VAAFLSFINLGLVALFFKDTLAQRIERTVSLKTGILNLKKAFTEEKFSSIFTTLFLISLGFSFFTQFFQAYLVSKFNFSQSDIGELFAYIGLWIALTQGLFVRWIPKSVKPASMVFFGTLFLGLALILLIIPNQASQIYFILPFVALSNGLLAPNSQALVSNLASENAQGEIFGINQSVSSLGIALAPVISGIIYNLDIRLPILMAGGLILLGSLIFKKNFKI
jgi:DHA1 family tetracycline resistance protein-like MFS transporter